jgi:hypothetical protein
MVMEAKSSEGEAREAKECFEAPQKPEVLRAVIA